MKGVCLISSVPSKKGMSGKDTEGMRHLAWQQEGRLEGHVENKSDVPGHPGGFYKNKTCIKN